MLADAVVVLEGAPARIERAVELIEAGYAETLIYPGLSPWSSLKLDQLRERSSSAFTVLVPSRSDTERTYEEALNTRSLLAKNPSITSILLVTSSYHTYRARWTFRLVLPPDITITTVSADAAYWSPDRSRVLASARDLFHTEQKKFFGYFFLYGWRRPAFMLAQL